jgi:hypothetical protein
MPAPLVGAGKARFFFPAAVLGGSRHVPLWWGLAMGRYVDKQAPRVLLLPLSNVLGMKDYP